MKHASLFSGIGACELAAEWMGWTNVFNCEIDQFCRKVLDYHYPNSIGYEDVKKTEFKQWKGKIDVLTAGFPCQPFSCAGQRRGTEDERYLWTEVVRAVREIHPSYVVGENVAGILSMVQSGYEVEVGREASLFGEDDRTRTILKQEYVVETICRDLEREGYSVQPFVIPACAIGAPHRRDRVWFIAKRVTTDTHFNRYRNREDKQELFSQFERKAYNSTCIENGTAPNSNGIMQKRRLRQTDEKREDSRLGIESLLCIKDWSDFPTTQPAVRRRDDGLPFDVHDLTISFSKWRKESIKAYGNSMVPQVVYEIFRAIEFDAVNG